MLVAIFAVLLSTGHAFSLDEPIAGEAILRVAPESVIDSVLSGTEAYSVDSINVAHTFLLNFSPAIPVDTIIGRIQNRAGVQHIQPNYRHKLPELLQMSQSFPDQNAPAFLLGVSPEAYYEQPAVHTTGRDSANLMSKGEDVVVGLIDNGIDFDHPLFEGSIETYGFDFVEDDDDPSEEPGDLYGHGTFVAGLVKLVAPDARLVPLRAFQSDGYGSTYAISKAIYWAVEHDIDIVNLSFGLYSSYPTLEKAVEDAVRAGVVVVAAAGNDGVPVASYPAAYDGVIAVGAIDTLELLADFSNFGDFLDVCAPGVNVYSSLAGEYDWGTWSGTSFAAPQVTGACALVLERERSLTPYDMEIHIRRTARTDFQWGTIDPPDYLYGYGCLSAFAAVLAYAYGDMNNCGEITLADITSLISFVYLAGPPPLIDERLADFNCNGQVNLCDITSMVAHIYLGGPDFLPCYTD